jgi:hypothetical protein
MKAVTPSRRRNFLLAASFGSVAAVAAVARARDTPKVAGAEEAAPKGDGYRASGHVLKYYDTTKV